MVAQLFPLPCYRKKRNQCCHFSWGKKKSKRNQTEQIQANSATHFSGLLKINMEKILKAEPQAANSCICFLFQLKILSITSQQISTLLAVSPHHRHHLVFSSRREQVSFCTVLENPVDLLGKENSPLRGPSNHKAAEKPRQQWGGCSELLAPSAAATLPGLQDRAQVPCAPDSKLFPQHPACGKQLFKKHHNLGGKSSPEAWNFFPVAPAFPPSFPGHTPAWLAILPSPTTK